MSDEEDYSSEDDLDYVPTAGEEVSEEDGSGEEEDVDALREDAKQDGKVGKRRATGKKKDDLLPRKRQGGIRVEGEEEVDDEEQANPPENGMSNLGEAIASEKETKKEEKEKKKADDLWSSFLSDVKPPSTKKSSVSSCGLGALTSVAGMSASNSPKQSPTTTMATKQDSKPLSTSTDKITITKVFDFAGEEVKVTKQVASHSVEGQEEMKKQQCSKDEEGKSPSTSEKSSVLSSIGIKRPSGGVGSLLSKLGKKSKISVLDKSKMDWDSFKKDEGIEDDMKIHNRGKQSYLERIAFLNRADVRQFEIEKSLRLSNTSKR